MSREVIAHGGKAALWVIDCRNVVAALIVLPTSDESPLPTPSIKSGLLGGGGMNTYMIFFPFPPLPPLPRLVASSILESDQLIAISVGAESRGGEANGSESISS